MSRILVVDDEPGVLKAFEVMLTGLGHSVVTASGGEGALDRVRAEQPDLVVTDICMPGMDGLEALKRIHADNARLPVIIMTGKGTMDTAIEATKLGAFDYQLKPFEPESMVAAIDRALESVRLMQRSVELNPGHTTEAIDAIVGDSPEMQEVFKAIGRVAGTDATVLLRGESGTGKELVARAIYHHSRRASAPLMVVNCVAIPESLLESELFGHERGAFTGAHARKIGKFEQAQGGTVFLDEIGDIPAAVQAKILRVLQQKTFERVGGKETIEADVRILAATNRNLDQAIADGTFREDLYHRLNVVTISIPTLRERRGDIPKLVNYFLDRYAHELRMDTPHIADDAMELLATHDWPGNVRELENCVYRILIFTHGYPIQAKDVRRAMGVGQAGTDEPAGEALQDLQLRIVRAHLDSHSGPGTHEQFLADVERLLIYESLVRSNGNQTHAAKLLGLTRPTLHARMQRYGIIYQRQQPSDS